MSEPAAPRRPWDNGSVTTRASMEGGLFLVFDDRSSDSPFVERVWRCHSERAGRFLSIASSHWEMVVTRHKGKTILTVRGPETKATAIDCPAARGQDPLAGTFWAKPVGRCLACPPAGQPMIPIEQLRLGYPDFENAEAFVARLVTRRDRA
jgi:hypothetical protein